MSPKRGFAGPLAATLAVVLLSALPLHSARAADPGQPTVASSTQATPHRSAKSHTHPPAHTPDTAYATHLSAGRFGPVTVYIPEGRPQSVAVFLSGDGGWELVSSIWRTRLPPWERSSSAPTSATTWRA